MNSSSALWRNNRLKKKTVPDSHIKERLSDVDPRALGSFKSNLENC